MSTDAAVADFREMEIEFGYFNLARERRRNTFTVPKVVVQNLEIVGEFGIEEPPRGSAQLVDPALSLKTVLKKGVLQEKVELASPSRRGRFCPRQAKRKTDLASKRAES